MSPKKPKAQRKDGWLKVRATLDQLERWQAAADLARQKNDELDHSSWVRTTLNDAARLLEDEAKAAEKPKKGGSR